MMKSGLFQLCLLLGFITTGEGVCVSKRADTPDEWCQSHPDMCTAYPTHCNEVASPVPGPVSNPVPGPVSNPVPEPCVSNMMVLDSLQSMIDKPIRVIQLEFPFEASVRFVVNPHSEFYVKVKMNLNNDISLNVAPEHDAKDKLTLAFKSATTSSSTGSTVLGSILTAYITNSLLPVVLFNALGSYTNAARTGGSCNSITIYLYTPFSDWIDPNKLTTTSVSNNGGTLAFMTLPSAPPVISNPSPTPVSPPVSNPVPSPVANPVPSPASNPVPSPVSNPVPSPVANPAPAPVANPVPLPPTAAATTTRGKVYQSLTNVKSKMDDEVLLYEVSQGKFVPSTVYRFDDMLQAIKVMHETGSGGFYFYLGTDAEGSNAYKYGLVNIAAFLAQSMKETIKYNACDENNWDDSLYGTGIFPASNACGQLSQSYQDYVCGADEAHMQCEVDPDLEMRAATNAKWWGAPQPLFCGPKSKYPTTGYWNSAGTCANEWANPPQYCDAYDGQKGGVYVDSPKANGNGRTDVEGCCYWGRGVIQTTGICNFGKLNYYLGKRAADEGRAAAYPDIDFCKRPDQICASSKYPELKWIAGLFYWMNALQSFSTTEFKYFEELRAYVDGGLQGNAFIDKVSGIVNRGCPRSTCATGPVDGLDHRRANFLKVLQTMGLK